MLTAGQGGAAKRKKARPRCLSLAETRVKVGVSAGTLRNEIKAGRLKVARIGSRVLVPLSAIDDWLAKAMEK